jgi:hypothetical protein
MEAPPAGIVNHTQRSKDFFVLAESSIRAARLLAICSTNNFEEDFGFDKKKFLKTNFLDVVLLLFKLSFNCHIVYCNTANFCKKKLRRRRESNP